MSSRRTIPLPLRTLRDPRVLALSHAAFRAFVYLYARLDGMNNGLLTFTRGDARDAGLASERTRIAAVAELLEADLVRCAQEGSGPLHPSRYALMTAPLNVPQPRRNRSRNGSGTATGSVAVPAPSTVAVRPQHGSGSDDSHKKHARGRARAFSTEIEISAPTPASEATERPPVAAAPGASVHYLPAGRRS